MRYKESYRRGFILIKAFMYHDVRDFSNTSFKSRLEMKSFLTISQFKYQLDYLIKNFTIIPTKDLSNIKYQFQLRNILSGNKSSLSNFG